MNVIRQRHKQTGIIRYEWPSYHYFSIFLVTSCRSLSEGTHVMWERLTCSSCHNQLKWGPSTALQSSSTLHQSEWARCGEPLWQLSCLASARFWSCHCLHAVLEESRWDVRTPKVGQRKTNMDLKKTRKYASFLFLNCLQLSYTEFSAQITRDVWYWHLRTHCVRGDGFQPVIVEVEKDHLGFSGLEDKISKLLYLNGRMTATIRTEPLRFKHIITQESNMLQPVINGLLVHNQH